MRHVLLLSLLGLTPVWAMPVPEAIRRAPQMAVVEVLSLKAGHAQLRRVEAVDPDVPQTLSVRLEGATPHRLVAKQVVLAPLARRTDGTWGYRSLTDAPMLTRAGDARAVARFAKRWRSDDRPVVERFDPLIALTNHPSPLARKVAFDALLAASEALRPITTPARIETLAAPLFSAPPESDAEVARRVGALGRLGQHRAARALSPRFETLSSRAARRQVAGLLARHPTREGLRTLQRCAKAAAPALASRCTRLMVRMSQTLDSKATSP